MKVRKQKLLSILLCTALTVTNIVSEGFQVSANELLPEQRIVAEDSTEEESEMPETQASEAENGGNLPSEETDSTGNEKAKETETETKEEETESDLKETEAVTWETESDLDEIETETTEENSDAEETEAITEIDTIEIDSLEIPETADEEAYPNALIPFEIGGTDIFAGTGSASFYSVIQEQPKYDPRTEAPEEMTSVKDQNPWGTCWSFAVMETLENSMVRQGLADNTIDLSERHLAYFTKNSGSDALGNASDDSITSSPSSTYLNSGGNAIRAAVRLMNWQGAAAESKYEYSNAKTEPAALSSSAAQDIEVMAHDIYFVPTKEAGKEEKISAVKKLIAEYGCVAWSYKHLNNCYNKENAAYYCPQKGINHAITVVGWDDDFPAEKFSSVVDGQICRPAENGAWIVKNSWGSDWGENGYFYISYEDGSLGSENPAAVSVAASKNEYDHNYFYGNTASIPKSLSPYFKVSQVYQIKNAREQLKAVSVLIYSDQADYSIQIYKNPILEDGVVKDPESGEPMLQTPETGKTGYTGLYTIDLSEPVIFEKGDYISVVIDFSNPDLNLGTQYAYLYTDENSTDSGQLSAEESYTVVNNNVTHEGQSFYYTGGTWHDAQAENFNFRINALTADTDQLAPVKEPVFDPEAGIIEEGQSVTIKADNDAEIYYTLDGSEPTAETGMKYSKPLEITEDVTIKAAAVRDGVKSKAAEAVYKYYKMKLILSETEAELAKDGTHQLEVLQKPTAGEGVEEQVSWESSDLNIVTVSDNGVITGISEGTAVITAKAEDYKGNMVTASCQVTVTEADNNIASGSYKDITWVIDADGKLTVEGTGDYKYENSSDEAPWYNQRLSIKSAEINVTGMTNAASMFYGCENLTSVDMDKFDTSNIRDMGWMFSGCSSLESLDVSKFDTRNVTRMKYMFGHCSSLESLDVSKFDTSKVTDMNSMFGYCSSLESLDVSKFDTSKVTDMECMFRYCRGLGSLDVGGFDTSNVTDMSCMFEGCSNLKSLDVGRFNTSNVTNMSCMFISCSSLESLDVSNFDTGKVTDMRHMFNCCDSLERLDAGNFDTSNVTDTYGMFAGCSSLISLHTPCNLNGSVDLPKLKTTDIWFDEDGNEYEELPQNLNHSILIKRNEIPIVSAIEATKTKTNYVCGNTINIDDLTVTYYDADSIEQELEASDYTTNADKIDMSTEGVKTLVITYGEMTTTIELTVTDEESDVIASGEYKENGNDITWVIDADGKLTVEGTGDYAELEYDYYRAPWSDNRKSIISAEIKVTGMTDASTMFYGCSNLISVDLNNFDTSNVTNMANMFGVCQSLASLDLSNFDTSNVTNMSSMFDACTSLTSLDLSSFDTSRVVSMSNMFANCQKLTDLNISKFNTSQVTSMNCVFNGCNHLTSLDVSKFDTSKVKFMEYMFNGCSSLTRLDVSSFETSQVKNMECMFRACRGLTSLDVSGFDTSQVKNMEGMFCACRGLTSLDLSGFDTSRVTNMSEMFDCCNALISLDMGNFDISSVTGMDSIFNECSKLLILHTPYNLNLSVALPSGTWYQIDGTQIMELPQNLDHSILIKKNEIPIVSAIKVTKTKTDYVCGDIINIDDLTVTYYDADSTARELEESEYTTNADEIDMSTVGEKTLIITYNDDGNVITDEVELTVTEKKSENIIVSGKYKENGNDITWVIDADGKLTVTGTGDFSSGINYNRAPWYENRESIISAEINVTGMTDASYMFYECENLVDVNMDDFNTDNVEDMHGMFERCRSLIGLDLSNFDTRKVVDMESMFYSCSSLTNLDVSGFVTDNVTDMASMFCGCKGLTNLDVSGFVTDNVIYMNYMFSGCEGLTSLDVSGFVTDNVTIIYGMFEGCRGLTSLDVSGFVTDNVIEMSGIFSGCEGLTSLDVSGFTTGNVTDMHEMFSGCEGLSSLDVSGFVTDNVTDMASMFCGCKGLTNLDVSGFVTDNVIYMDYMFSGCEGLTSLDVSGFNTDSVIFMSDMFSGCRKLTSLDVSSFDTANVASIACMFEGCSSLPSINISNFDVGQVEYAGSIFDGCSTLATIHTPCNLKLPVSLPVAGTEEVWYQPDGTAITELPQNLSYSIMITKNQKSAAVRSLSAQKIKTAYNCGEELELNDLTVTYTAENGVDTEVTDYTTNAAEIDMSTPGIKILAITYEGITVELELIVTYLLDEGTVEIILPDETYIYDGTAKQPEPIVTASKTNTKLTSGKDYTISYESNIDAGTAFMIITGQNDYQGTLKSSFRINKAAAPETVEVNIYTPCNKVQEGQSLDIAGRYGEYGRITGYEIKDIVEDNEIDGTVFAGTPYIQDGILYYGTNTGKDGDSAAVTVEVSFANYESALLNVVVEFTDERAVYTVRFELAGHGQPIAPITVLETGSLIEEPIQPEAEGFRFMGWYKDQSCTKVWDFDTDTVQDNIILYAGWLVEASDSEGADLYIQEIQNQIYTGSALKPSIRVYAADGDTRLKEGKDYTIKYFNNKNADQSSVTLAGGTSQTGEEGDNGFTKKLAYVIIKGKGNYKGTIYRNFHIDAASIAGNDGEMAKGFTLKYKEQLLHNASKAQKPFQSIRYKKNMKAGTDYEWKLSALEAYDSEGNKLERGNVIIDADSFVPLIPAGYKGTFLLTITGIGNYKGSIDKTVCVTDKKHLLKNATVSMGKNCKSVRYTGEDITLRPAYYDASQKKYYTVDDDGVVSTQAEPDGNNVFVVKAGGKCLKYGEDYTVSYTNNQAVGTATMTISGKGEYLGSKDVTFRITGMAFNAKNISVDGFEASMEYTGKPLTQNGVRLKSIASSTENSIELTYGKDYTVNYKNNLKKGTATMTFTANPSSGYTGRFKKTFKITAASLTDTVKVTAAFPLEDRIADGEVISLEGIVAYEKAGAKPSGRIRLYNKDGILLKEGIDYSVSYAHNKVVTTADTTNLPVMNLKGKGNYTGSLSVNFRITAASMEDNENLAVTAAEVAFYKNKADNYTYQPKITVMDGKHTLNSRTDYTVRYERCTQAEIKNYLDALQGGRATEEELEQLKPYVLIEAKKGNGYVGSIRKELTVYRTKLTGNNLYIVINTDTSQITYTGEQVKPEVTVYYGDLKAVKKARNKKETREKILTDKTGDYCLTKLSLKISENGIGDYTLSYGRNVTAGKNKGNVTVIGTGLYGGRVKVKFTINSKDVYTASK